MAQAIFEFRENKRKNAAIRRVGGSDKGYGNSHDMFCNRCKSKVYSVDWGNSTGYRYVMIYAEEAGKQHLEFCLR